MTRGGRLREGLAIGRLGRARRAATTSCASFFSRSRLNLAISRAQALDVLVASLKLLEIRCASIEDMQLVNALCRSVELAQPGETRCNRLETNGFSRLGRPLALAERLAE